MGLSNLTVDANGPVMDLSNRDLQKLEPGFCCSEDTHTLILDRNQIMKLDHLEQSISLQQLSVAANRLVRMMGVSCLTELRILNLPNNSIGYIEGLRHLPHLEWLNLSGNNIKVIEQLNSCVALQHLDLSNNSITHMGDLSKLTALKTLLLHENSITTLRTVPAHLPPQLIILSLAENEIRDLNEVSFLSPLHDLEQLSIMSNPCVMATASLPGYDHRPYVMSWCLSLKVLDGYAVSQKEWLKAEWLYSQGKGRLYRPGQHVQLVQYLASVCPLTSSPALETAEDAKLEKILSKQRLHQRQLLQQSQEESPYVPCPLSLEAELHGLCHAPQGGARDSDFPHVAPPLGTQTEPVLQVNPWLDGDTPGGVVPQGRGPPCREEQMYVEDIQTDEEKLNSSLLSSDSTFLPLTNPAPPQSDSEDEPFEPDSLAPEGPTRTSKSPDGEERGEGRSRHGLYQEPQTTESDQSERDSLLLQESCATVIGAGPTWYELAGPQRYRAERSVVRIQAWWRGLWTRRCHPVAKEVRCEIRLRRMQEHIVFLSGELERVQRQHDEERLQRLVQEEAVRFLWKQLQSMQQWQQMMEEQIQAVTKLPASGPAPISSPSPAPSRCDSVLQLPLSAGCSAVGPGSFPDSGFQSSNEQCGVPDDSLQSSGTGDSLETVRAWPKALGAGEERLPEDSQDCSLLEEYLSSVQQMEEDEERGASDRTGTPLLTISPPRSQPQPNCPSTEATDTEDQEKNTQEIVENQTPLPHILTECLPGLP